MQKGSWMRVGTVLALLVLVAGCGGLGQAAARQKRMNQIKAIGLAYHNYYDANNKGPSQPGDLVPYLQDWPDAQAVLQDGSFVFIYDVKLSDMTQGTSNTVLGHDAQTASAGGIVLMADGTTRMASAADFAGLTLAKPKK